MTMKKMNKMYEDEEAKVDMTPMLDIVFIMLIFFIVTTSFVKEKSIDVSRPDDNKNKTATPSKHIAIQIDATGMIVMNGRQVDIRRVTANVQTILAEKDSDTAIIRAHKHTSHGRVVEVMDQVKEAGIEKLSILATPDP